MSNLFNLALGEIQRMKRYNILTASLVVTFIWIGVLYFTDIQDVSSLLILLLFMDITSMPMLLIEATMFFEKQEGVTKALLVSPINKNEYILSKVISSTISSVISLVVLYSYAKLFKEIDISFFGLLGSVVLINFFHSLIGFILTYSSRDFNSLLMGLMKYAFIMIIPVFLEHVGVIDIEIINKILYALPTKASMILLNAASEGVEAWELYLSLGYMIVASAILYYVVFKKFDEFAVKESGV